MHLEIQLCLVNPATNSQIYIGGATIECMETTKPTTPNEVYKCVELEVSVILTLIIVIFIIKKGSILFFFF